MIRNPLPSTGKLSQPTVIIQAKRNYTVGQTLKAFVVAPLSQDRVVLNISGHNIIAKSNISLGAGKIVTLKVVSLTPKPTMKVTAEQGFKEIDELFPTVITLKEASESDTSILAENIRGEIEATIVEKNENLVKILVGSEIFEGTTSNSNVEEGKLKLKVLSIFPEITLEVVSGKNLPSISSLLGLIDKYTKMKETLPFDNLFFSEEAFSGEKETPTGGRTVWWKNLSHSLSKGETWVKILKHSIEEYISPTEINSGSPDKLKAAIGDNSTKSVIQQINNIISENGRYFLPLPFPLNDKTHRADLVVGREDSPTQNKGKEKKTYSAFISLNTDLLGTLEIRIQLSEGKISAEMKGDKAETVKLIEKNLDLLTELLRNQGFHVGRLSVKYREKVSTFSELLIIELTGNLSTQMDIIV